MRCDAARWNAGAEACHRGQRRPSRRQRVHVRCQYRTDRRRCRSTAANLDGAQAARDASLYGKGIFPTTAAAVGFGVAGFSTLVGGAGGMDGTFDLAFAGGAGSGAAARSWSLAVL